MSASSAVRRGVVLVTLGALAAAPRAGWAAPPEPPEVTTARTLTEEGVKLYDAGKYDVALERFERARALVKFPTVALMSARTLEKLGRLVEASERYLAVSQAVPEGNASAAQKEAPGKAARERAALLPRIPTLQVRVGGVPAGSAGVTVDGTALREGEIGESRPVDPGRHHVEARQGDQRAAKDVEVAEGAHAEVQLDLTPAFDPRRPLGIAAVGVGGALFFAGVVTGAVVLTTRHDLDAKGCSNDLCPASLAGEVNRYDNLRVASSATLVLGAAFAAAGVALVLLPAKQAPATAKGRWRAPTLSAWIGPAAAGLRGELR